jgi:acetylornithine deacetylase
LLFFAHPDSEPIAGIEVWNHPPFAGEIDQGRLHGWGVADDLVGVAMMLAVLESVLSAGFKPKGTVILASTPSKRRAQGIISILNQGHVADGAVYLHPAESGGGLQEIKAVTSGLLRFRLTIAGKPPDTQEPSHTAFHHLAIDPLDKAWIVYSALRDLAAQRVYNVHYQPLEEAVGRSTNLHIAYMHYGDEDHLSRVSPACVLAGSLTFPPDESMDEVQRQVEQAIYTAAQQDTWLSQHPPALEWLLGISGAAVPIEHSLYQTAHQAILKITGEAPYVNPLHSTSDIRNPILHKGIPTIGFGPLAGNFSQAGHHDEWVDVEDYTRAIKVTGSIIVDWCGV